MRADAVTGMALEQIADLDLCEAGLGNLFGVLFGDHGVIGHQHLAGCGIHHFAESITADDPVRQAFQCVLRIGRIGNFGNPLALGGITALFTDDHFLRHIHQTAGQITGICGTQSRIRQRLTRTTGTHEIFKDLHTFAEVGLDRNFHCLTVGCKHRTTHSGQLSHLLN